MLFVPPPPPVSYSRQVAPILALHCNGCHGGAGGLSTRAYADLIRGGNLGKVLIPGEPDNSLLVHFVEGRRGETHRMPLRGRPLSPGQIETLRRWIAQGAKEDALPTKKYTRALREIRLKRAKVLHVFCRINSESYVTLTVRDPRDGRVLLTEAGSIKAPKEEGDAGQPQELISWDIHAEPGWPRSVTVELTVEYTPEPAPITEFFVTQV